MEVDIEYDNGWRETITIPSDGSFKMPFGGKIVAMRLAPFTGLPSAEIAVSYIEELEPITGDDIYHPLVCPLCGGLILHRQGCPKL